MKNGGGGTAKRLVVCRCVSRGKGMLQALRAQKVRHKVALWGGALDAGKERYSEGVATHCMTVHERGRKVWQSFWANDMDLCTVRCTLFGAELRANTRVS